MDICPICLHSVYFTYYKCKCKCKKVYHLDCIQTWFKHNNLCPICRQKQEINNINSIIRSVNKFYESLIIFSTFVVLFLIYLYYQITYPYPILYNI